MVIIKMAEERLDASVPSLSSCDLFGFVAWLIFTSVIPWRGHGMTPNDFTDPRNKAGQAKV